MDKEKTREQVRVDKKGRFIVKRRLEGGEGTSHVGKWGKQELR